MGYEIIKMEMKIEWGCKQIGGWLDYSGCTWRIEEVNSAAQQLDLLGIDIHSPTSTCMIEE